MAHSDSRPERPDVLGVTYSGIPAALKDTETWVCWRYVWKPEREEWAKVPVDPHTGNRAKVNDSETWASFDEAKTYHDNADTESDGLGFVFTSDHTIVGIDLDDARNPENARPTDTAKEIINRVDSFTEVSPSGTGYHAYVHGLLPENAKNRKGKIEIYDTKRFFTVTGNHVIGTPESVERRNGPLQQVHGDYVADSENTNRTGTDSRENGTSEKVDPTTLSDSEVVEKAQNATNGEKFTRLWRGDTSGYPSHSEARMALLQLLAFWTGGDKQQIDRLFQESGLYPHPEKPGKWERVGDDEIKDAIRNQSDYYDPEKAQDSTANGGGYADTSDGNTVTEKFVTACEKYQIDSGRVGTISLEDDTEVVGVGEVVAGYDVGDAILGFNRDADLLDGTDRQAVVGHVVYLDLQDRGEFFKTPGGRLYYFCEEETDVYRVDGDGRRTLTERFQGMVWDRYNLFAGKFSRNLGEDVKTKAQHNAPEREVYRFSCYNEDTGELFISDFGNGYYALDSDGIEWRANGSDVYFLSDDYADPFEYIAPTERRSLPDNLAGERDSWIGSGDPIMRMFGNRVNYDESAALGPMDQRNQLYIHLHTLPFIDLLNARPIVAWVGEKGSGKTVIQRSIGRFIYGGNYTESVMPDDKDDFMAKVTNQSLAFLDNYDDGQEWANDVLAAIATGSGLDKRELYTTNALRREVPRCWLSLTSRDPPFRRDDVADRTLVFRVERVEDGFVGMGDYLSEVTEYRNLLWSVYLDNLQAILEEYHSRETGSLSSSHRMADWAIFATIVADALDVDGIDDLLEVMETERATFALENEPWAAVVGEWVGDDPDDASTWRSAGSIGDRLESVAADADLPINTTSASGIGYKLNHYHNELTELYNLEVDDSGASKQYRFNVDDDTNAVGLGRFH